MVGAGFFSNEEPSFKTRQLFFQQKLDTVKNDFIFEVPLYIVYNVYCVLTLSVNV